ncbi:MAG: hypothetical protein DRI89_02680 [Bacteroidetes bacterium]|nr:MAG: hypothetical protein DRI89_02680 [Bacteroidota bacterium]
MKRLPNPRFFRLWTIVLLMALSFHAFTQEDSTENDYQKEFDNFLNASQQEFDNFKSKNDSIFYQFLLDNWKEYELLLDEPRTTPKPKEQPKIDARDANLIKEIKPKIKTKTIRENTDQQIQLQLPPKEYKSMGHAATYSTVSFYGSDIDVPIVNTQSLPTEAELNQKQIANFFRENADNTELIAAVYHIKEQAIAKNLNAWGYLRLLQEASVVYFKKQNDRVLFTWLALLKTNYDAIVGYSDNDIFLLVHFDVPAYYISNFEKDGKRYYITPLPGQTDRQKPIVSYEGEYPESLKPVSLHISDNPLLAADQKTREIHYKDQTIPINYNQNMVDFYNNYPACELAIYFPPPLSQLALESLNIYFDPVLRGKTKTEKASILLDFVQTGFPYRTDEQQFGKENYLFAEESIFNEFSDCEDRSVLLAQLIEYFTDLNTIGLVFPGHVSLAVAIPEEIEGTYINYNGSHYYICDPTYIGSKLGMMMPEFEKIQAEIIDF